MQPSGQVRWGWLGLALVIVLPIAGYWIAGVTGAIVGAVVDAVLMFVIGLAADLT